MSPRYAVNSEVAVAKVIDGEAIVINVVTGRYYSLEGPSATAWQLLAGGATAEEAGAALAAAYDVDAETARAALASLPPEQKQVIELAYFRGLSHTEIAAELSAPVGTVKGRIRLGLDRLRVLMGVPQDALSAS